jgi:hypothetical protein
MNAPERATCRDVQPCPHGYGAVVLLLACALLGLMALASPARAELLLTLRAPESTADQRQAYENAALRLALDKTLASHGAYRIQLSPMMNKQRAVLSAQQKAYPNFLLVSSPVQGRQAVDLAPVPFPLHLGLGGYRVCFVAPEQREAVAGAQTVEALRRFRHAQGSGWADTAILRANGFQVTEVPSYEALFQMVAKNRIELFCRSVLEVRGEALAHAALAGLVLDRSFLLVYDLPQFFYTHRDNRELIERLSVGLQKAYGDGSLLALFRSQMLASLRFAELPGRRVFRLLSPPVPGIDFDYHRYDLDPMHELR